MAKIKKRKGYQAPSTSNTLIGNSSVTSVTLPPGLTFSGSTTISGTVLSPNQFSSSGYVYTYDPNGVTFEDLAPIAVNHNSGRRLIVWEPS